MSGLDFTEIYKGRDFKQNCARVHLQLVVVDSHSDNRHTYIYSSTPLSWIGCNAIDFHHFI